jgi:hypothetical protein
MLDHHVAGDEIEARVREGKRSERSANAPGDIKMLAQVIEVKIDADDDLSPANQFVFKGLKVLAQQAPAATRV